MKSYVVTVEYSIRIEAAGPRTAEKQAHAMIAADESNVCSTVSTTVDCPRCKGSGIAKDRIYRCLKCEGNGYVSI